MNNVEVCEYQTTEGKAPLTEWLASLRDGATRAHITARLDRLKAGYSVIGRMWAVASAN
jgi:putative component of toxin-antitoxin plasmid stabilization module